MSERIALAVAFSVFFSVFQSAFAQEVNCTVQVNTSALPSENIDRLRDFGSVVSEYVNRYEWGGGGTGRKVRCTLEIAIRSVVGPDRYRAQVFIGTKRPIANSDRHTGVLRLFDQNWEFTYIKGRPPVHSAYEFDEMASFLDYYMYIIIGCSLDSYTRLAGTPMFQKAADIANLGRSRGQSGWQLQTGTFNRVKYAEELLSPTYEPVRRAIWRYNSAGLDSLVIDKPRAQGNIVRALGTLERMKQRSGQASLLMKVFFDTNHQEIAAVLSDYTDPTIFSRLSRLDPAHQSTYENARATP